MQGTIESYGDNFIFVIPVDVLLHEPDRPFCLDPTCPCKRDEWLLWEVSCYIEEGLMTLEEGQAFVAGRTV